MLRLLLLGRNLLDFFMQLQEGALDQIEPLGRVACVGQDEPAENEAQDEPGARRTGNPLQALAPRPDAQILGNVADGLPSLVGFSCKSLFTI